MLISVEGTSKNQAEPGLESMGDTLVLSYCSLLSNAGPKQAGELEHCREGETKCWFYIFLTASKRR